MSLQERQEWLDFYHPQRTLGKPGSYRYVSAEYVKYGKSWRDGKGGKKTFDKKALFKNVTTKDGRYGTDHLWLDWIPEFDALVPGDKVEFGGVVRAYTCKGSNGSLYRTNTQLGQIQRFRIL